MDINKKIFAQCVREALGLYFESATPSNASDFSEYINEKSDYEVIHLLATKKFPSKQFCIKEDEAIDKIFNTGTTMLVEITAGEIEAFKNFFHSLKHPAKRLPSQYSFETYKDLYFKTDALIKKSQDIPKDDLYHMNQYKENLLMGMKRAGDFEKFEKAKSLFKRDEIFALTRDKVSSIGDVMARFGKNTAIVFAVLAVVSIILYAGYTVYQRFYSNAAKACNRYKGEEKDLCMKQHRINALQKQEEEIRKGETLCNRTTDPEKCRQLLRSKMAKLDNKLKKLRTK